MNEQGVKRLIEEEDIVSNEKLSRLMHEAWDLNFQFWGKENFREWINNSKFPNRIKNIAISEFIGKESEEEDFLFEIDDLLRKNKILNVHINETNYYVGNKNKNKFVDFIDTGLNTYLDISEKQNKLIKNYSLVQFVKLLNVVLGDLLIKAYLSSDTNNEKLINKLSELISTTGRVNSLTLKNFYNDLDIAYKYFCTSEKILKKDLKKVHTNLQKTIQNMVVNYIGEKVDNLEYYNEEKIDFNKVSDDVKYLVELAKDANILKLDFENVSFENEIYERVLTKVIEGSHLVVEEENKKQYVEDTIKRIFCEAEYEENKFGKKIKTDAYLIADKAGRSLNKEKNVAFKLAEIQLSNNVKTINNNVFNIAEFIGKIANLKEKINISKLELDNILGNYLLKNCASGTDIKIIEDIIKNKLVVILNLDKLEKQQQYNSLNSKFIKIDAGKFVEKRDGQYYYIDITQKGQVREKKLISDTNSNVLNYIKLKDIKLFKNGVTIYKVQSDNIKIVTDLQMDMVISINKNNTVKKSNYILNSISELKDEVIFDAIQEKMNIKNFCIIKDTNKEINYSKFNIFLKSILDIVPDNKKDRFVNEIVDKLLNEAFEIEKEDDIDTFVDIENNVKLLLKENQNKKIEKVYNDLDNLTKKLNILQNNKDNKNYKYAFWGYKVYEGKKKYNLNIEKLKEKQLEEDKNKLINEIDKYIIDETFIDDKTDFPHLIADKDLNCCVIRKVDIKLVTSDVDKLIKQYPKKKVKKEFDDITMKLLINLYGKLDSNGKKLAIYTKMQDVIKDKVIENIELDIDRFKYLQEDIHAIIEQEYKNDTEDNNTVNNIENYAVNYIDYEVDRSGVECEEETLDYDEYSYLFGNDSEFIDNTIFDDNLEDLICDEDVDKLFGDTDFETVVAADDIDDVMEEVNKLNENENVPENIKKFINNIIQKSYSEIANEIKETVDVKEVADVKESEEKRKTKGIISEVVKLTEEKCCFSQIYDAMEIIRKAQTENLLKKYNPEVEA